MKTMKFSEEKVCDAVTFYNQTITIITGLDFQNEDFLFEMVSENKLIISV